MGANNIKFKKETKTVNLLGLISAARIEYDRASDRLLPKSSSTKPSFVTSDDTFLRLSNYYFDPEIWEDMQKVLLYTQFVLAISL